MRSHAPLMFILPVALALTPTPAVAQWLQPPSEPPIQRLINDYIAKPSNDAADRVIRAVESVASMQRLSPGRTDDGAGWPQAYELCTQVLYFLSSRPPGQPNESELVRQLVRLLQRAGAHNKLEMPSDHFVASPEPAKARAAELLLLEAGYFRPVVLESGAQHLERFQPSAHTEEQFEAKLLLILKHVPPLPAFNTIWPSWRNSMRAKHAISYTEGRDLLNSIQPLRRHLAFPEPDSRAAAAAVVQQLSVSPTPWLRAYAIAVMAHPPADLRDDDLLKTLAADNHRLVRETLRLKFPELLPTETPSTTQPATP